MKIPNGPIVLICFICSIGPVRSHELLFDARVEFYCGQGAYSVAAGDLNGDGVVDLAVSCCVYVSGSEDGVSVLIGNGNGTFQPSVNYAAGTCSVSVAIDDLDEDGNPDLAVANLDSQDVSILLGNGDGTFHDAVNYAVPYRPLSIASGDVNGDGHVDIVLAIFDSDTIAILLGSGDGSFTTPIEYPVGYHPRSVAIGDLDGDGDSDIVAANGYSDDVSVLFGSGDGSFEGAVSYETDLDPQDVVIADLNADNVPDLAVATYTWDTVCVLLGNGDGTFREAESYQAADGPQSLAVADLNGDGILDLAVASAYYYNQWPILIDLNSVSVLIGNGDGTFQAPSVYEGGDSPNSIVVADVDDDGEMDLITANRENPDVSVFFGTGGGAVRSEKHYEIYGQPDFNTLARLDTGDVNRDGYQDIVAVQGVHVSLLTGRGGGRFDGAISLINDIDGPRDVKIGYLNDDQALDLAVLYNYGVWIVLGRGDGTFQSPVAHGFWYCSALEMEDLDSDGDLDLVITNSSLAEIIVLLGNGDATYEPPAFYPVGSTPGSLVIADFTADGHLDLAVADNVEEGTISIMAGSGDGTFETVNIVAVGERPSRIASGDLNGDGGPDLAVAYAHPFGIDFLFSNNDGTFQPIVSVPSDEYTRFVVIGDVNADGLADVIALHQLGRNLSVFLGTGGGTFAAPVLFGVGNDPAQVAIADLDQQSSLDLAVINRSDSTVSVLLNLSGTFSKLFCGPGPAGSNEPLIRVFPPLQDAEFEQSFLAYGTSRFGANVTGGDLDGDGADEILTGPGPGEVFGPHVRGFDSDGMPLTGLSFLAYGTNKFGVNVAAGELDGDGFDEIITGAGPGAVFGPHVRAFNYDGTPGVIPVPGVSFFAYGTPKWGVNVAAGDIDGDGYDEIITGAGPGAVYGPHVRGWNVDGGSAEAISGVSLMAYGTNKYGVNVTAGDVDGDGIDEIVTGAGPGAVFGPHVRGWNYDGSSVTALPGCSFFAWQTPPFRFGVNVFAGADLNSDGRAEIVAGRGPDPEADTEVKVFTYNGVTVSQWLSLDAFPGMTHGVKVAAGRF